MMDTENTVYDISALDNLPEGIDSRAVHRVDNNNYQLYTYKNPKLDDEKRETIGIFRSVITRDDEILCFSPPKSMSYETFKSSNTDFSKVTSEEFIEGTMINLFYDKNKKFPDDRKEEIVDENRWEITTKSVIGADNQIKNGENTTSFRRMFLESMIESGLEFHHLNKEYCYSFVVQHPKNRIVKIITKPSLYLIAIYKIDGRIVTDVTKEQRDTLNNYVKFPEKYYFESYDAAQEKYASMDTYYDVVGIMFKNSQGHRTKLRNPIYEKVKHLRGNNLKLQFQYMALRQIGKVGNYLKYYPEDKGAFSKFRDDIHQYTRKLHKNYISCYIKKNKPLVEYDFEYKTHMFKLHEKFISELRNNGKNVSMEVVIQYVNNLHPAKLMYTLNQPLHKQKRDIVKTNLENKKNETAEMNK